MSVVLFVAARGRSTVSPRTSCRAIGISESSFYKARDRLTMPRLWRRDALDAAYEGGLR
ncbi:MAG TPA: hypothetical protein VF711_04275 [Acidimicrobiales bacterium]|jgi:hypothetical protein